MNRTPESPASEPEGVREAWAEYQSIIGFARMKRDEMQHPDGTLFLLSETERAQGIVEQAISSAAVAEAEATVGRWKMDVARAGRNAATQYQRAEAAERALEEAREAIREWARGDMGHLPFEDGSGCQRCLRPWPCSNARLRALVSTESREEAEA